MAKNTVQRNSLLFLGSGSGDFYLVRKRNDMHNNRYPTQVLLPYGCLIDFSSEATGMLRAHDVAFDSISDLFITHSQLDHFHAPTIVRFALERRSRTNIPLNIWGTEIIRYMLEQEILLSDTDSLFDIHTLEPLREYSPGVLRILPIPANHLKSGYFKNIGETALNFLISVGSKKILYAVDTGYPEEDVWELWREHRLEVLVLEATLGDSEANPSLGHLNFDQAAEIVARLRDGGILQKGSRVVLAHLSPFHISKGEKTVGRLSGQGISLASDGMKITF